MDLRKNTTDRDEEPCDGTEYRSIIGKLLFAANIVRFDINYIVSKLSRHIKDPLNKHLAVSKRVLRYLKGTTTFGLIYVPTKSQNSVAYSDASFASEADKGYRSITGYMIMFGGSPVTLSKIEVEVVKVLLALCSYYGPFYDDGAKTGFFFDEAYHPWKALVDSGADVSLVSETGTFGWDQHSLVGAFAEASVIANDETHPFINATKNIKKASDINPEEYDIFFAAGGHGAIFDFPVEAKDLHQHILAIAKKGGVVAAVCHGPAIFENIETEHGEYFIKGKNLTGFTDDGEKLLKIDHIMKARNLKTPKEGSLHAGANYIEPADPWASFTVTDGKLVTGVNPASATGTAEKALAAFN